ncbi:MAG: hypothetical protein ABL901_20030 [Hyphomicrobiaceae bacterium]
MARTPEERLEDDFGTQAVAEFKFALADRLGRQPTTLELFREVIALSERALKMSNLKIVKD